MSVSIVIPAYNEEKYIRETLDRIGAVLSNHTYEIIVVDNASTDATRDIIRSFCNVELVELQKKVTISRARNIGWAKATYEIVAFLDADVLVTETWANELINLIGSELESANFITGCKYGLSEVPSHIESVWFASLKSGAESYINSGNLITSKYVLSLVHGFAEDLITGEDVDFCQRAKKLGVNLVINHGFVTHHEGYPRNVSSFFKRERWHGVGDLKGFKEFFSSKVALTSFLFVGCLLFALVCSFLGLCWLALVFVVVAFIINIFVVCYKFNIKGLGALGSLLMLNAIYFLARVASLSGRMKI